MHYVGIDLHKAHSQICVMDSTGKIVAEHRIPSKVERFEEILGELEESRVLVEASGLSEWAARAIERLGKHEVIVGDPGYALMYGARSRKVKTDLRDARALAEACRIGAYRKSYRSSDADMRMRRRLVVRRVLVDSRTAMINALKGCLRQLGLSVPSGSAEKICERVSATELPGHLRAAIAPLLASIVTLNRQIEYSDEVLERMVEESKAPALLATVPGVGPVTACTFAAVVGDATRFSVVDRLIPRIPGHADGEDPSGQKLAEVDHAS